MGIAFDSRVIFDDHSLISPIFRCMVAESIPAWAVVAAVLSYLLVPTDTTSPALMESKNLAACEGILQARRWNSMVKVFSLATRATVPVAAFLLATSLAAVAWSQEKSQLTGHWDFNQDQSDDAQQRVQDAQQNSKNQQSNAGGGGYPGGGGGYPGGGMGRIGIPGIGGIGGGGGGGGMGRGGRQSSRGQSVSSQDWDRLAANPRYLRIDQRSDQVVVTDDSDNAQTYYPDDKKHDDKDADGNKVSTKASWQGDAFIAETKLPRSEKLTQTFRVSDDRKELYVTTLFEAPSLNGPVSIRRVYDIAKPAVPAK
jgi:hypothetical protein